MSTMIMPRFESKATEMLRELNQALVTIQNDVSVGKDVDVKQMLHVMDEIEEWQAIDAEDALRGEAIERHYRELGLGE